VGAQPRGVDVITAGLKAAHPPATAGGTDVYLRVDQFLKELTIS
jgi:hypothetical protein